MPRGAIFTVPYDDEARIEIQVSPVQVADFGTPHTGVESDSDDCLTARHALCCPRSYSSVQQIVFRDFRPSEFSQVTFDRRIMWK